MIRLEAMELEDEIIQKSALLKRIEEVKQFKQESLYVNAIKVERTMTERREEVWKRPRLT